MMGAGKSTVGPLVASRLELAFVDLDDEIEKEAGRSVPEIFAAEGESGFRRAESAALSRVLSAPGNKVVSVGGGAVLDPGNRTAMESSTVVWLRARTSTLASRVGSAGDRPLLTGSTPAEALSAISETRRPLYAEVSDAVVDVDRLEPGQVADEVVDVVRARLGRSSS